DVLAPGPRPAEPVGPDTVTPRAAVPAGVLEVAPRRHVPGVLLGGPVEPGVVHERPAAVAGAGLVGEPDDGGLLGGGTVAGPGGALAGQHHGARGDDLASVVLGGGVVAARGGGAAHPGGDPAVRDHAGVAPQGAVGAGPGVIEPDAELGPAPAAGPLGPRPDRAAGVQKGPGHHHPASRPG